MDVSTLLVLVLAIPAAGFLLRTFIVFHDCAHGSFLAAGGANEWLGVVCGLLVYSPFHSWRHEHAVHHATAGDLDRRGMGDVDTLTVAEYRALLAAAAARLPADAQPARDARPRPAVGADARAAPGPRLGAQALRAQDPRAPTSRSSRSSAGCAPLVGWRAVLLVQLPTAMLAGAAGIWLFYVQHQFEDVYWERKEDWSYADVGAAGQLAT